MKNENEIKELLIGNAIHLIAEGGFEMATTKALTHCGGSPVGFKMNEVYIYRIFGSKEAVYDAAFARLDDEIYSAFRDGVSAVEGFAKGGREKLLNFFSMAWSFVLKNEDRCRCYVRYYYSVYFKGKSLAVHRAHFDAIAAEMAPMFKEEADVHAILHSVFTTLLDFAIRVYNGDLPDNDINRPHVYAVLYNMMAIYLNDVATTA